MSSQEENKDLIDSYNIKKYIENFKNQLEEQHKQFDEIIKEMERREKMCKKCEYKKGKND